MSGPSSINGATQSLYQFLKPNQGPQQDQDATASDAASTLIAGVQVSKRGHHQHCSGQASKIESAVAGALQNYNGSGDVNQVVESAIASTLQGGNGTSTSSSTAGQAASTVQKFGSDPAANAAFVQLLQQYGISPQQFQDDVQTVYQNAGQTPPDVSQIFKNLPPGSTVDLTA
jgi:hypothetical protein